MQVFDLRWKTCIISDQIPVVFFIWCFSTYQDSSIWPKWSSFIDFWLHEWLISFSGRSRPSDKGEGGRSSRPWDKGGGWSPKKNFWPFKPQSQSKNKWGGYRPLPWICHWVNYDCSSHFLCFISFSGPCCRCRRFIKMWHVRWQPCRNGCQKQLGGSVDVWLYTGLRRNWTNEVGC